MCALAEHPRSRFGAAIRSCACSQLGVLERRVDDLIVEITVLVVANEVRAEIFIAGSFRGLGPVPNAVEESLRDLLMEVHAWKLSNDLLAEVFGDSLVIDAERIDTNTVVDELHLNSLIGGD